MDGLFQQTQSARRPFSAFGDSAYWLQAPGEQAIDLNQTRRTVRTEIRERVPDAPGVYGMVDRQQTLIYVGMSQRLRQRLQTYFLKRSLHGKESRISGYARTLVWQPSGHGLTALLRELELIRRFRPKFNVRGKSERARRGYLFLTSGEAPHFRVDRFPARGAKHSWGPLPIGRSTRAAVERLNYHFQLRDCPRHVPMAFSDQRQLFDRPQRAVCLRAEMNTCLGPCAGMCSRAAYASQLEQARGFLDGRSTCEVIEGMETAMLDLAAGQQFEQAAALRDTWETLGYLADQVELAREVHERYRFVYPVACPAGLPVWYVIAEGRVHAVVATPQCSASAAACLESLREAYPAKPSISHDDLTYFDEIRIVASWFRQQAEELDKTLAPEDAAEMCRGIAGDS